MISEVPRISDLLSNLVLMVLIIVSAYTDIKYRKIYNKITLPSLIIGLLLGLGIDFPDVFLNRLAGFGVGFGLFFLMFVAGYMGGGDVKLIAAIGALTGYPFIIDIIFFGILSGGLYAIVVLIKKGLLWKNMKRVLIFMRDLLTPWRQTQSLMNEGAIKIPYGLCISVGTLIAFIIHELFTVNCFFLGY